MSGSLPAAFEPVGLSGVLMRRGICAVATAFGLLCAGAGAAAASGTTVAFSDTQLTPLAGSVPSELTAMKGLYCAGKGDRGGKLSLTAALRVAARLVAADSHGRGLRTFTHSKAGHGEVRALAAAAGALGAGKPAAGLAGFLRAHQLTPKEAIPLIDAAPLLSEAGQGRAALALLDAAAHLKAPKTDPLGISWRAIALNNRGQALIVAHKFGAAEKALTAARKAAPLLREARQNLALAYDCDGKQSQATHMMFLAVRRQQFPGSDFVDISTGDPFGQLDESEVLDTSRGATLTLPALIFPKTMDEGVAQRDTNFALQHDIVWSQEPAIQAQITADNRALDAQLANATSATKRRTQEIISAPVYAMLGSRMTELRNKTLAIQSQMHDIQLQGESQAGCANAGLHGQWLSALQNYDAAQRTYAAAEYKLETALAANLKNSAAHKVMLDQARLNATQNFFSLVAEQGFLDSYDSICDTNIVPSASTVDSGQTDTPPSPACPSGIVGPGFTVNLLVFAFSVTCEEVKGRVTIGSGWLNGFVSVSHNFRNATNTIFAGPQVGAKIDTGPFEGGVTARGGIYATFNVDGSIADVGLRAESSAGAKIEYGGEKVGGVSIAGPSASISLAGAFAPPF
jgi:hypothetical protein